MSLPVVESTLVRGLILQLSGLSKAELNGVFVEVQRSVVSAADGSIRWKCVQINGAEDGNGMSLKAVNLMVPSPSFEALNQAKQLSAEGRALFRQALQADFDQQILNCAVAKLNEALVLVPNLGSHGIFLEISHKPLVNPNRLSPLTLVAASLTTYIHLKMRTA